MKGKKIYQLIYCLGLAVLFVTLCSRSSFLYPMNNWDDSNCYLTIGKSMLHGKVLYKDIFDHKGPYLYFLYGLAYLIDATSFFGVYLLEILSCAFSLFFAFHIIVEFASGKAGYILTPLFAATALSSASFYWGGSAEEMFLPFLLWSLWIFVKNWKSDEENELSLHEIFVIGICAGVWALVKYTLLLFFASIMILLLLHRIYEKDLKNALKYCIAFFLGFVLAFIPWVIYFVSNGAVKDWIDSYILINYKYASGDSASKGVGATIYNWVMTLYWDIYYNPFYMIWVIVGMFGVIFGKRKHWITRFDLWVIFGLSFVGIYLSGTMLKYYALPLCIFAPIGLGMAGRFAGKLLKNGLSVKAVAALSSVMVSISAAGVYKLSNNVSFMKETDYYLFTFRDIILESEDPSLLNYGCLDAGLFTLCDIQPEMKWFHQVNAQIPEMFEEQQNAIDHGLTEYVYARSDRYPANIDVHYELVSQIQTDVTGVDFTYYLFRRK